MILTRYGYMESKEGTAALQTEEGLRRQIKKAVMDFQVNLTIIGSVLFTSMTSQAFAGLNQTGFVDAKTQEMMDTPR